MRSRGQIWLYEKERKKDSAHTDKDIYRRQIQKKTERKLRLFGQEVILYPVHKMNTKYKTSPKKST